VRDRLAIHEALLEAHVAPHGLHHAQRERVEVLLYLDRGKHVVEAPAERLHPAHVGLVALEARDHVLCAGQLRVRPLEPAPHHRVFRHVHAFHRAAGGGVLHVAKMAGFIVVGIIKLYIYSGWET